MLRCRPDSELVSEARSRTCHPTSQPREQRCVIPSEFGRVALLIILGLSFPALPLVVSQLLFRAQRRPEHPDPVKNATYECGVESEGSAWGQFNARYYIFALGFVIFDVEVIFLFPWAVNHAVMALTVLIKAALFISVLAFGLAYAWRRGALEWR
jgi:NADH:ubiquinone oxidoreductase subunit 3 (subunit A)